MKVFLLAVAAFLLEGASSPDVSQAAALARASQRGALLYAYDQAAWHGTDDMLAKLSDPSSKVGGYIVDGPANAPRLIFFDKTGEQAVYVATFNGNRLIEGHVLGAAEDRSLSALDRHMVLALAAARSAVRADGSVRPCAPKPFNTAVLPPDRPDGPIPVYFLTPQTRTEIIPFGGHYEVDVDASGHAGSIRHFTKSCVDLPTRPVDPSGATPVGPYVTHLLDPTPTEIHVFNSLQLGMPVMVAIVSTNMMWTVRGSKIDKPIPLPNQP